MNEVIYRKGTKGIVKNMRVNTQSNAGSYYETADFALDNNDKRLVKRGRSLHQFSQSNIFLLTHIHTIMICFNDKNTICTTDWNVIDSMIGTLENCRYPSTKESSNEHDNM